MQQVVCNEVQIKDKQLSAAQQRAGRFNECTTAQCSDMSVVQCSAVQRSAVRPPHCGIVQCCEVDSRTTAFLLILAQYSRATSSHFFHRRSCRQERRARGGGIVGVQGVRDRRGRGE